MASQCVVKASSSNFSDISLFFLPRLHTLPSFMSISLLVLVVWQFSFIRDWSEICKLEILSFAQYPVWVFPNIWRLGRVRDAKFVSNVSNEKLLNASKSQDYSFKRFWVIKENQQGGNTHTHTHTHTQRLDLMNKFHIYLWSIQAKIE